MTTRARTAVGGGGAGLERGEIRAAKEDTAAFPACATLVHQFDKTWPVWYHFPL
jgi:hypothetical protein